jgi:hypothetical protein
MVCRAGLDQPDLLFFERWHLFLSNRALSIESRRRGRDERGRPAFGYHGVNAERSAKQWSFSAPERRYRKNET